MRHLKNISRGRCFVIAAFLIFTCFSCETGSSVDPPYVDYFVKYFGGDGDQMAVDFLVNSDNSIIILGNSKLDATSGNKIYLIKTDGEGNRLWEKTIGNTTDVARDVEFTKDGNMAILSNYKVSDDNSDFKIVRITVDGVLIDSVSFGTPKIETAESITPLIDGGFIVTGSTSFATGVIDPDQPDESDIFHFRCNSALQFDSIFWKSQFGSGPKDIGTKVMQYAQDIFYVFGSTDQTHSGNPNGNESLFYYPIDNGGVNGQPNYLGNPDYDTQSQFILGVPAALGEGYLVAGTEYPSVSGTVKMHVAKLRTPLRFDSTNDELFDHDVPVDARNLTLQSAATALNGGKGYLLLANEQRETGNNIWITKIDQNGDHVWSASYGSEEEDDVGAAITELQNGKILVVGSVRLINNQYKIVLMKLNSTGQLMK
jgi:hypothetical protein